MEYKYILDFHEINKDSISEAGGKGANLGEMTQAHFPVPGGFVLTSSAYKAFIEENDFKPRIKEILDTASIGGKTHAKPESYQRASERIKALLVKGRIPDEIKKEVFKRYFKMGGIGGYKLVAVRSSATAEDLPEASFAGQQETFLNIKGEANLLNVVRACWASLFTPRAIFYREEKNFDHFKVSLAVVVQEMVQSEISGIAFTNDPMGRDKHKMIIEAVWGLGEYAVQGTVTPDRYELERHSLQILEIEKHSQKVQLVRVGNGAKEKSVPFFRKNRQKLSEDKVKELARILQKIHAHYYFPQDVEWAYKRGKFYIIQARPITTLESGADSDKKDADSGVKTVGEIILTGQSASPGIATGRVKIITSTKQISKIKKGDILVAKMTSPDYVPAMKQAGGIITDEGGVTSHAAIVSRELGIACVVGTGEATKKLKDGMTVTVNGKEGIVLKGKASAKLEKVVKTVEKADDSDLHLKTATKVYVNLAEPELAVEAAKLNVDGVGLLRAEFMIGGIGEHPRHLIAQRRQVEFIEKLEKELVKFCKAFNPRPVVYRTTDFKTNEYRHLSGGKAYEPEEPNPMLGFRGAYRYIADPDVFELEIAAIKRVREIYKNLWVMIPFVRSPEELLEVKRIMAASGLVRNSTFKLWMMVELPVNVIRLEDFIEVGIDGVSVGSNDLTMLLLGTDRDNSEVRRAFTERDPSVLWALERVLKICHKHKITSSICGQSVSSYDDLVEFLVKRGITSVSVNTDSVSRVRQVIHECEKRLVGGRLQI